MRFSDVAIGGFLICFALSMIAYATSFPLSQGSAYGAGTFPFAIGGLMICAGLVLAVQGLRAGTARPLIQTDPWLRQMRPLMNVALVLGMPVLYILASDTFGFLPIAALMLFALTWQLTGHLRPAILSAAFVPLAIHTFFVKFLLVPLPWGLLGPVAW